MSSHWISLRWCYCRLPLFLKSSQSNMYYVALSMLVQEVAPISFAGATATGGIVEEDTKMFPLSPPPLLSKRFLYSIQEMAQYLDIANGIWA